MALPKLTREQCMLGGKLSGESRRRKGAHKAVDFQERMVAAIIDVAEAPPEKVFKEPLRAMFQEYRRAEPVAFVNKLMALAPMEPLSKELPEATRKERERKVAGSFLETVDELLLKVEEDLEAEGWPQRDRASLLLPAPAECPPDGTPVQHRTPLEAEPLKPRADAGPREHTSAPSCKQYPPTYDPMRPLCEDCERTGYPHCLECELAHDATLVRNGNGQVRVIRQKTPEEEQLTWTRCELCRHSLKTPRAPFQRFCAKCRCDEGACPAC